MTAMLSSALLRTQTDARLIEYAQAGHEPAFEALVQRYRKPLLAYCRRLLLPEARAEDVVQQAFLSAWTSLTTGTEVSQVRAWLYRITHNAAVNALKRSGYDYAELHDALRGADAPQDDLERRIAIRETLAAMANLPELQREALIRTAIEGDSHEQVALDLGLTGTVVRGLVYRARVSVRSAASALTPPQLIMWAASRMHGSSMGERMGELVTGGGGSASLTFALLKGGAVIAAAGTIATGTGALPLFSHANARASVTRQAGQPTWRAPGRQSLALVVASAGLGAGSLGTSGLASAAGDQLSGQAPTAPRSGALIRRADGPRSSGGSSVNRDGGGHGGASDGEGAGSGSQSGSGGADRADGGGHAGAASSSDGGGGGGGSDGGSGSAAGAGDGSGPGGGGSSGSDDHAGGGSSAASADGGGPGPSGSPTSMPVSSATDGSSTGAPGSISSSGGGLSSGPKSSGRSGSPDEVPSGSSVGGPSGSSVGGGN